MADYTVDALLTAVRAEVSIPSNESSATDARLLALLNREQSLWLQPHLYAGREDYQLTFVDVPIVSGTLCYRLPSRAAGNALHSVDMVDGSGRSVAAFPFSVASLQERQVYGGAGDFYLEGSSVVFPEAPQLSTMRVRFYQRLNTLVKVASIGIVQSINTGTGDVTLTLTPAFPTAATSYDFIQATPPFDTLATSKSATRASTVLTFTPADLPSDLAVGDHVTLAGETAVCQAPLEWHSLLVLRGAYKWLRNKGDPKAEALGGDLNDLLEQAKKLIEPRVAGTPPVVINYNAPGWNKYRGYWRRQW